MMGFGIQIGAGHRISHEISHAHKLEVRALLQLLLLIREEGPPDASRGLPAMRAAHRVLVERGLLGLLIGGLLRDIHLGHGETRLGTHKDCDVLIPTSRSDPNPTSRSDAKLSSRSDDELPSRFEAEIDWWLPTTEVMDVQTESGRMTNVTVSTWRNGNGVNLLFGAQVSNELRPGLYLPDAEFLVKMLAYEAIMYRGSSVVKVDAEAEDAFVTKLREKYSRNTRSAVARVFHDQDGDRNLFLVPFEDGFPVTGQLVRLTAVDRELWVAANSRSIPGR